MTQHSYGLNERIQFEFKAISLVGEVDVLETKRASGSKTPCENPV